ncbi:AraC family transcriptional regulator [Chitinophagaceae bacterium LWZ2-11]
MKVEFEIIKPDEGSSFRVLHQKVPTSEFVWQYHYHPEIEITCVLYGSGTRHVGNHWSNYENGDLVFIGANLPHSGFGINATDPHEEIVIQIKSDVIKQSILNRPEMEAVVALIERSKYGILFTGNVKERVTEQLILLKDLPPFERFLGLLSVLQTLATSEEYSLLNTQIMLSSTINKHKNRLQKVFTHVEQCFNEDIDIKTVAGMVNLSVPSFCNYFKKTTHITFTEFLNRYRIQRACFLLQQDKTVAEVSYECGFNNVTYFNKVFKSIVKKTPSEFARER